jgi:hypothetical protein
VLMEQQDPGDPGITGCDLEFLDELEASTRWYQSALTLISRTVSTMCKARLKLGIGASMHQTPRILPDNGAAPTDNVSGQPKRGGDELGQPPPHAFAMSGPFTVPPTVVASAAGTETDVGTVGAMPNEMAAAGTNATRQWLRDDTADVSA